MLIPVAFKNTSAKINMVLAGDVGGTKINIALYKADKQKLSVVREESFHSKDYSSLTAVIRQFIGKDKIPAKICLAVAGPVLDGKVKITNLPWQLDSYKMNRELGGKKVFFINDLEATAYGIAGLKPSELHNLVKGNTKRTGNIAILAPGTGLGEAGLYWDGKRYHPFASEGGHSQFASRTQLDFELYNWLNQQGSYVSWEHVICGPGIHNIFRFLVGKKGRKIPGWLKKELQAEDPSAVISENAISGRSKLCVEVMQLFVRYLATESSSLVLKYKATGGLYLGGGILPKILPLLKKREWQQLFFEGDRMEKLLRQTPVNIILNDKTALIGAAYYGAYS